jgi:PBSX family phage terminase large subunit
MWQQKKLCRLNLLEGSVSSGKTWISLVLWGFWVATMPKDKLYLMCGKSLTTLKRNCLVLLEELFGTSNFTFSTSAKEAYLFGRRILLEGANDARSESKIRGLTLQGAYCDELTLFPRDFFVMLLSRLRVPGAKLIATTNPDSPEHWLKKEYIERMNELDLLVMRFLLDDNTTLDPAYIAAVKQEYTGVFYQRFILGEWAIAEGLVYPMFDAAVHTVQNYQPSNDTIYYISIDYGTVNPCSMGLWALEQDRAVRIKEAYYGARATGQRRTDEQHYQTLLRLADGYNIQQVVVDPSAASFITLIRQEGRFSVRPANNSVLDGVRLTGSLLSQNRILFSDTCKDSIREFHLYRWDETKTTDTVIKENDHAMDDIRYFCCTILQHTQWADKGGGKNDYKKRH